MDLRHLAMNGLMRPQPPQPLGHNVNHFSVDAATPLDDPHPSGYSVRVKLDNPHPDDPFRTGEFVSGCVCIHAPPGTKRLNVPRLSLRVYFESRTLYWGLEPKQTTTADAAFPGFETVIKHEVHRGVVNHRALTLSWNPLSPINVALESGEDGRLEAMLPFSFFVPRRMHVTEYSKCDGAPRELCYVERCPPPTLRDSRFGSVQWVVEAVMDLVPAAQKQEDEAMLRLPTKEQVLTRIVLPVLPSLEDVDFLRDEPYFGRNLATDSFGSRLLSQVEMEAVRKASMENIRARGGSWEMYVREIDLRNKCTVSLELYTLQGAQVTTDSSELPLVLFLKHTGTQSSALRTLFRSTPKPKSLYLRRVMVRLLRITSTRGGNEIRPHTHEQLIRRRELRFDKPNARNGSTPSSGRASGLLVPSEGSAKPLELDITLDLQSQTEMSLVAGNQLATPARDLTPSFRMPNIQHEYLLTVSLWFAEDTIERFAARLPVQVVPSDENQLPLFEDAVNAQPPAFVDIIAPPQYV